MSYSKAEIDAELSRRGEPIYTKAEIDAELAKRGEPIEFDPFQFQRLQKHGVNYENPFTKLREEGERLNKEPGAKAGWPGVAADVANVARETPQGIWNTIKPQEILGFGNQLLNDKVRLLQTGVGGVANAGRAVAGAPTGARNYLEEKGLIEPTTAEWLKKLAPPNEGVNYAETLGRRGSKWGDEFAKAMAILPLLSGSKGNGSPLKPSQALTGPGPIPNLYELAKKIPKPDIDITPTGIIARRFGGNLPMEQIERNATAAEGTKTGLGRILQSPGLNKTFENISSEIPFGGGSNLLSETGELIAEKGRGLMPNEYYNGEMLNKIALDARAGQNKIKNEMFQPVSNLEKQEKFTLQLPKTSKLVNESIQTVLDSPYYKNNKKFQSFVNKISGVANASEQLPGTKEKIPGIPGVMGPRTITKEGAKKTTSIVQARTIADDLYDTGKSMVGRNSTAIDQEAGKKFMDIAKQIRKEVKEEITRKGSDSLQKADALAMHNYRENYSPFLNKEVHKLLSGDELSETFLLDVIRPSKTHDKANRITKINNLLPENEKKRLGEAYLAKAFSPEGSVDPRTIRTTYNKLGPNQKEALYTPEVKKALDDFVTLVDLNPEAVNRMFNPKTGARVAPTIYATSAVTGAAIAPLTTAASFTAQAGVARYFNKLMTDPEKRKLVIKKIAEERAKKGKS